MSEFTSVCPKCRQQILCDTAYVGMRVACPICLQEITMPTPGQQPAASTQPNPASNVPAGKSSPVMLIAAIGGVVLVLALAVGGIMIAYYRGAHTDIVTTPPPAPVAITAPAPQSNDNSPPATRSDIYTNHLTLDTKSFTVKITEVRKKNVMNCLSATYNGVEKNSHRGIVVHGEDTYAMDASGTPNQFLGWTFKNGDITYFVSESGELKTTQGTNVLVSEQGKWKQKPKR